VFREQEEEGGSMEFDNKITPLHFFTCQHSHSNFPSWHKDNKPDRSWVSEKRNIARDERDRSGENLNRIGENLNRIFENQNHTDENPNRISEHQNQASENVDCTSDNVNRGCENLYHASEKPNHNGNTSRHSPDDVKNCNQPMSMQNTHQRMQETTEQVDNLKREEGKMGRQVIDRSKTPSSEKVFHFLLEKGAHMLALDAKGRTPLESLLENLASDCQQVACRQRMVLRALELIRRGGYMRQRDQLEWYYSEFALAVACKEADILLTQFLDCGYMWAESDSELLTDAEFQARFGTVLAERVAGRWVSDLKRRCRQVVRNAVCFCCCCQTYFEDGDLTKLLLGACCLKKLECLPLPQPMVDYVSLKPVGSRLVATEDLEVKDVQLNKMQAP
jgi:hypothetical protein